MGRIPLKRANSTSDPSNKKAKRTNYVEHQEKDTVPTKKTDASMTEPAKILREMLNAYEEQIQRDGACLNQFQETLDSCVTAILPVSLNLDTTHRLIKKPKPSCGLG
ncbi:uncharacterized protein LOC142817251 isoform X2 [Rhipicephalus microplus]|uniref:uncharacterized protein LOC142817251 isoform X2 n=1 Tax=Rhipicephalus microplus TaxID=6941 RepID=UPI003F6D5443